MKFRHTVIYGGVNQFPQTRALDRGVHIAVATPGRLLDLLGQGFIKLSDLDTFVLDEADRMLDMGFLPDLKRIIEELPEERQSIFFSATMSDNISNLAESLLRDPVRIEIAPVASTTDLIDQRVMYVDHGDKPSLLEELLGELEINRILVFTRTKHGADKVARLINNAGVRADSIHGDKTQNARTRVLNGFKHGHIQALVATDIAARGIDVDGISHVINYNLPDDIDNYVHRIGRTGRAGATGMAISFCDNEEFHLLRMIERLTQQEIYVEEEQPYHSEDVVKGGGRSRSFGGKSRGRNKFSRRGSDRDFKGRSKKNYGSKT